MMSNARDECWHKVSTLQMNKWAFPSPTCVPEESQNHCKLSPCCLPYSSRQIYFPFQISHILSSLVLASRPRFQTIGDHLLSPHTEVHMVIWGGEGEGVPVKVKGIQSHGAWQAGKLLMIHFSSILTSKDGKRGKVRQEEKATGWERAWT